MTEQARPPRRTPLDYDAMADATRARATGHPTFARERKPFAEVAELKRVISAARTLLLVAERNFEAGQFDKGREMVSGAIFLFDDRD